MTICPTTEHCRRTILESLILNADHFELKQVYSMKGSNWATLKDNRIAGMECTLTNLQ